MYCSFPIDYLIEVQKYPIKKFCVTHISKRRDNLEELRLIYYDTEFNGAIWWLDSDDPT